MRKSVLQNIINEQVTGLISELNQKIPKIAFDMLDDFDYPLVKKFNSKEWIKLGKQKYKLNAMELHAVFDYVVKKFKVKFV